MKKALLLLALAIGSAVTSTSSFAKVSYQDAETYHNRETKARMHDRHYNDRQDNLNDQQRTSSGPEIVHQAPFKAEG